MGAGGEKAIKETDDENDNVEEIDDNLRQYEFGISTIFFFTPFEAVSNFYYVGMNSSVPTIRQGHCRKIEKRTLPLQQWSCNWKARHLDLEVLIPHFLQ